MSVQGSEYINSEFVNSEWSQDAIVNGSLIVPGIVLGSTSLRFYQYLTLGPVGTTAIGNPHTQDLFIDPNDSLLKSLGPTGALTTYNPLTTSGDVMTWSGVSGTQVRVPLGISGQVLTAGAGPHGLGWTTPTGVGLWIFQQTFQTLQTSATNVPIDYLTVTIPSMAIGTWHITATMHAIAGLRNQFDLVQIQGATTTTVMDTTQIYDTICTSRDISITDNVLPITWKIRVSASNNAPFGQNATFNYASLYMFREN